MVKLIICKHTNYFNKWDKLNLDNSIEVLYTWSYNVSNRGTYFNCIEISPHHGFSKNTELVTVKLGGTHRLWSYTLNKKIFQKRNRVCDPKPFIAFFINLYSSLYKTTTQIEIAFNIQGGSKVSIHPVKMTNQWIFRTTI